MHLLVVSADLHREATAQQHSLFLSIAVNRIAAYQAVEYLFTARQKQFSMAPTITTREHPFGIISSSSTEQPGMYEIC